MVDDGYGVWSSAKGTKGRYRSALNTENLYLAQLYGTKSAFWLCNPHSETRFTVLLLELC